MTASQRSQPHQTPNSSAAVVKENRINPELLKAIVNGDLKEFQKILGPNDIESNGGVGNGGSSDLCRVTCGGNTALHVVVMEKSSPINSLISNWDGSSQGSLVKTKIAAVLKITGCLKWVFHKNNSEEKCYKGECSGGECCRRGEPQKSALPKCKTYMEIAKIINHKEPTLLNAQNNATKETPLHCAAKAGKLHMVSLLVDFAKELKDPQKLKDVLWARNQVGETALHEAARSGFNGIVKLLLLSTDENLASVEDYNGISPLYLAVAAGSLEVVQELIAGNRQPSYGGPDEQTALHAAVLKRKENIMLAILQWKYGCEEGISEKTDKARNTPLHYAALIGNTNAVKELLLQGTNSVYEANSSGSFPVHLAAEAGNFEVIKKLLRTCPDVGELLDNEKRNFLHIAVEKKKERVIMLAYKEGINVNVINAKDKDGNTPLHLAVINSESEIFTLLCQNKRVNLHIRNDRGLTPLDLSASLRDHQFTYSLNPQSIIHLALATRDAFQNPCRPDLSKTVNNFWKARAVLRLNQREGKEMLNGVEVDIEKESTKYENMSKSLITGAVLIASATYVSTFTVSGVYREDNTPHTLMRRNFFKAFIIVNMAAFICAIVSTIWLLYSALSNFHLKYRKFYFKWCTSLFHVAINLFILTFGLGGYIAIAPLSEWLALLIFAISIIVILWNVIWNPSFLPLIFVAPYT